MAAIAFGVEWRALHAPAGATPNARVLTPAIHRRVRGCAGCAGCAESICPRSAAEVARAAQTANLRQVARGAAFQLENRARIELESSSFLASWSSRGCFDTRLCRGGRALFELGWGFVGKLIVRLYATCLAHPILQMRVNGSAGASATVASRVRIRTRFLTRRPPRKTERHDARCSARKKERPAPAWHRAPPGYAQADSAPNGHSVHEARAPRSAFRCCGSWALLR